MSRHAIACPRFQANVAPFIPGWFYLLERLRNDEPTITRINLGGLNIEDSRAASLASAIETNRHLKHLDLHQNDICALGASHLAVMLRLDSLVSLNLESNNIEDDGASCIAAALVENRSLTRLHLDFTRIGDEGATHLARSLQHNRHLSHLGLDGNGLGDAAAFDLANALSSNCSLQHLDLNSNLIRDAGGVYLAEALARNASLKSLSIEGNPIGSVGVLAMGQALSRSPPPPNLQLIGVEFEAHKVALGLPFCFSTGRNKEILTQLFPGASRSYWSNDKVDLLPHLSLFPFPFPPSFWVHTRARTHARTRTPTHTTPTRPTCTCDCDSVNSCQLRA